MIRKSFIFLEKIGKLKEKKIWKQGITDWEGFLKAEKINGVSKFKKHYYDQKIKEASIELSKDNYNHFVDKLPNKEMWRLYPEIKDESCLLDLEVDSYGKVILIGISDEYNTNFFVKGVNLELVKKWLEKYKLVITFNGSSFDLPKMRKQLGIEINKPHIDLKPLCIKLGLKGGLKKIEKVLGLKRPTKLLGNPVELWRAFHASGDKEYLDLLIEYNKEDVENLKFVMEHVYRELEHKLQQTSRE